MNKNSKIYIAGHRGLVGSAIVKNLREKSYNNLIYRTHRELDLTNQSLVESFFIQEQPEYVILAAAKVGGIMANNTYRAEFIYDNLQIQNNVIHQAYLHKVKKLLFLGSTCIYPKGAIQPMDEDCLLSSELEYSSEPYAIAKIAGIKMCEAYNLQYDTNFISVMPTNLYGPHDNFDLETSHVLPALIRKIHLAKSLNQGKIASFIKDLGVEDISQAEGVLSKYGVSKTQVEIWGTGSPRREFLYSEDLADACVFLLENRNFKDTYSDKVIEIKNTHINIGTGIDISIRELAQLIKNIVGFNGDLFFNDTKPDGTMVKLTNSSKLHSLGWRHLVELKDGIQILYDWYLSNVKQN